MTHEVYSHESSNYVTRMGFTLSTNEEAGIFCEVGGAKMFGNKTSKTDWLDQVEDRWDKLMFQEALNWKTREIPKELKNRLSNKVGD